VRDFELRGFGTDRVPLFSAYQKERLKEMLNDFGARVIAISPGLFKVPYPLGPRERFSLRTLDHELYRRWQNAHEIVKYHLEELLPASLEYAKEIEANLVVVFGFHRGSRPAGPAPDEVLEALQSAAKQAGAAGLQLAVEVEDGFWADTGARTAEMIKAVGHPALGVNWDPGNALVARDTPYPDGYQAVRGLVRHVHFKDVACGPGGVQTHRVHQYVIKGQIDWAGQIRALARDGYDGHISVETHMQPKVYSARAALERLRQLIGTMAVQSGA
jgi:sugar phosphate isomerase/epimerase